MAGPSSDPDMNTTSSGDEEFDLEQWTRSVGLTQKTEKYLRKEELIDRRSLSLVDERDLNYITLPLGQRKLLLAAVQDLRSPPPPTQTVNPAPDGDEGDQQNVQDGQDNQRQLPRTTKDIRIADLLSDGKTFNDIINNVLEPEQPPEKPICSKYELDPRTILTVKAQKQKALHIADFLPPRVKKRIQSRRRDIVLNRNQGDNIVMRMEDDSPYAGIYMHEWGAANIRLMHALVQKGMLGQQDTDYYLSYTVRIFELAAQYDWENILAYDHQYRELQAEHGFQWGIMAPDMELRLLAPRQRGQKFGGPARSQQRADTGGPTQQADCKMFLARGSCRFGANCKYRHPAPTSSTSGGQQENPASSS